jgi:monoamine oxidase
MSDERTSHVSAAAFTPDVDVIVVGAGFGGLIAARELGHRDLDVLVVEGRDRCGGRTWVDARLGTSIEMGGTWVHWLSPHVWSEISRYELPIQETGTGLAVEMTWMTEGRLRTAPAEEAAPLLNAAVSRLFGESRKYFPLPYADPSTYEVPPEVDARSIGDVLDDMGLDADSYALAEGMMSAVFNAPMHGVAVTQGMRWTAAAGHDWETMFEVSGLYKLANGTSSLVDAIAGDVQGEIRLSTPVEVVERRGGGLVVGTRDGQRLTAKCVIVTAPRNALCSIDFRPALSEAKQRVLAEGSIGLGTKVWIRARGDLAGWSGYAREDSPLSWCGYYGAVDGDSLLVGFGPSTELLDVQDLDQVRAAIAAWRPDIDVVACTGHDWVADEFSRQTFLVERPGQRRYIEELQRPEGGVFLAGSDYASCLGGYISGAIESAYATAPKVVRHLGAEKNR